MNHMIRKVNLISGYISTIAGNGILGFSGDNSNATLAELNAPTYVIEYRNDIYFSDTNNNRLRMINGTTNFITTIAGTGIQGFNFDGEALKTHLSNPRGLVMVNDVLHFVDTGNQRIRYLDFSTNRIYTLAGTGDIGTGELSVIGIQQARFNFPSHLSLSCGRYQCYMYLTDTQNYQIRVINDGAIDNFIGTGIKGNTYIPDNQLGRNVILNRPECTHIDPISQMMYISDTENNRVLVSTLDYNPFVKHFLGGVGSGGKVEEAEIIGSSISSKNGNLYVSESTQNRIRKISPDGTISNIAGNGIFGMSEDGSQANISSLASPKGIFVNQDEEVIFTELGTSKIRKITKYGELITIAGNGASGYSGDGSNALFSNLNSPSYVSSSKTDLFISDTQNFRIRRVGLSDGIISTVAGNGKPSTEDSTRTISLVLATNQSISPDNLVVTSENTVYFIDNQKYNIMKLTPYCDEGYDLYQFRSCLPICYGKIGQIDPTVCSSKGQCQSPNNCLCDQSSGYGGNDCQIPICFKILGNDSQVCSSNGTCIDANRCQCNSGFTGNMCQIPICFGKVNEDSCGGNIRGQCVTKDTCICNSGYTGSQCELFTCQGISEKNDKVCSGNGQCSYPDFCTCNFGYSGDNCAEKTNLFITIGVSSSLFLCILAISIICIISMTILFKKYKQQKKIVELDDLVGQKLLSFSENTSSYGINYTEESFFIPVEKLSLDTTIRKIGSGTSNVYQTVWNGHSVAVKVYDMNNLDVGEEEFISEARILATLRNPNIVTFYGFSNSQTKRYIVMELMESNLQQLITNLQKRVEFKSIKQKIDILIRIASGIEYLHTLTPKKIIHRDLKPANILYENGKCKLCDFGLSKAMDNQNTLITNNIGTLYYCPPEVGNVIRYETVTAIDIYSLSIIMWQLLFEISDPYNYVSQPVLEKLNLLDEVVYPSLFHLHKQICDDQKRPTIPFDSLETCQAWSQQFDDIQHTEIIFNLCELIKNCWSHSPSNRPSIEEVLNQLHILYSHCETNHSLN